MDVRRFLDIIQIESPLPEFAFVDLLGAPLEALCAVQQGTRNEFLGNLVPFVQSRGLVHSFPNSVPGEESAVDGIRVLEHQLLSGGTAARLGAILLVDTFEDRQPHASLAATDGIVGGRAIGKPRGDSLKIKS
jgi:hypothetical protein